MKIFRINNATEVVLSHVSAIYKYESGKFRVGINSCTTPDASLEILPEKLKELRVALEGEDDAEI